MEVRFDGRAESALGLLQRLQKEELIQINVAAYVYWPVDRKKPKTQQLHSLTAGSGWGEASGGCSSA